MCLLNFDFHTEKYGAEYDISLSAWGKGRLSEDGLLDAQKPAAVIETFRKRYRRLAAFIEKAKANEFYHGKN